MKTIRYQLTVHRLLWWIADFAGLGLIIYGVGLVTVDFETGSGWLSWIVNPLLDLLSRIDRIGVYSDLPNEALGILIGSSAPIWIKPYWCGWGMIIVGLSLLITSAVFVYRERRIMARPLIDPPAMN